jgi:hypothetical protein
LFIPGVIELLSSNPSSPITDFEDALAALGFKAELITLAAILLMAALCSKSCCVLIVETVVLGALLGSFKASLGIKFEDMLVCVSEFFKFSLAK